MKTYYIATLAVLALMAAPTYMDVGSAQGYFDRDQCYEECREDYLQPGPGSGYGPNYAYNSCLEECDNKFWKRYNRDMKDLD